MMRSRARLMSQAHEPGQLAESLYTRNRKGHANDRARSAHRARARARSIRRSKAEILTFPTSSHTYPGDTIQRISPQPLAGQGDSRPARRCMHPCMHPRMHPRRAQFEQENGSPSRESSLSKTTFWSGSFRSRPCWGRRGLRGLKAPPLSEARRPRPLHGRLRKQKSTWTERPDRRRARGMERQRVRPTASAEGETVDGTAWYCAGHACLLGQAPHCHRR